MDKWINLSSVNSKTNFISNKEVKFNIGNVFEVFEEIQISVF